MKHISVTGLAIILGVLIMSTDAFSQDVEYKVSPLFAEMNLPFSDAVRVGNMLYLSGQLGLNPETMQLVEGGIGPETRQTLENIRATLERSGATLDNLVKCTIFVADIAEWPAMNEVYATFFSDHFPARAAFGANGLALGARVEIDCFAVLPS